jgi:hypothetical protein
MSVLHHATGQKHHAQRAPSSDLATHSFSPPSHTISSQLQTWRYSHLSTYPTATPHAYLTSPLLLSEHTAVWFLHPERASGAAAQARPPSCCSRTCRGTAAAAAGQLLQQLNLHLKLVVSPCSTSSERSRSQGDHASVPAPTSVGGEKQHPAVGPVDRLSTCGKLMRHSQHWSLLAACLACKRLQS